MNTIQYDLLENALPTVPSPSLTLPETVSSDQWKVLDKHEQDAGAELGKSRLKVENVREMLDIMKSK
jgi:hypothetical protein